MDADERDRACDAFMMPQGMGCARQVLDEDDECRWGLFDDEGDLILISSLSMIRTIAMESGLVLCSVH